MSDDRNADDGRRRTRRSCWPTRIGCPGSRRSRRTRTKAVPPSPSWSPRSSSAWSRSASSSAASTGSAIAARRGADNQSHHRRERRLQAGPANPGGMNVSGEGSTALPGQRRRPAQGQSQRRRRRARAGAGGPGPAGRAAARAPPRPRPGPGPPGARAAPAVSGPTIQLGAFSTPGRRRKCLARARRALPLPRPARPPGRRRPVGRPHRPPPLRQRRQRPRRLRPADRGRGAVHPAISGPRRPGASEAGSGRSDGRPSLSRAPAARA